MSTSPVRLYLRLLWLLLVPLLLVLYLRHIDLSLVRRALQEVRLPLLGLAVGLHFFIVLLKARRLRRLLAWSSTRWLMSLYLSSYASENLVFSQAGLGARVLLLCRAGVPLGAAVGSQMVEKLLEGAGLLCLALPFLPVMLAQSPVFSPGRIWLLALALLVFALVLGLALRLGRRARLLRDAAQVTRGLRRGPVALEVSGLTLVCWGLELLMVTIIASAFGASPGAAAGVLTLLLVNLAMVLPGLPASIGPFEAAAVLGFQAMGLPPESALPAAVLYHLSHTVPVTLAGLLCLRGLASRAQR